MSEIRYFAPLERAFAGMKEQLFRPFDLTRWLVLGFSCWLAQLTFGGGGGGGGNLPIGDWDSGDSEAALLAAAAELPAGEPAATDGVLPALGFGPAEASAVGCAVLVVLVALVVILVLVWVSARGQFLFLDNAVHRRARIVAPWKEFRSEGNSLFFWQLGFFAAALLGLLMAASPAIAAGVGGAFDRGGPAAVLAGVATGLLALGWLVVLLYTNFFLTGFVVPIMHRERVSATAAWRVLLPLLRQHPGRFVLVGLFVALVYVSVGIAILVAGLATCCILLILLIVPYVNTVVLLPVYLTYRLYTLEFLAQFSDRFDFLGAGEPPAPPPPLEPPPPPPPAPEPQPVG